MDNRLVFPYMSAPDQRLQYTQRRSVLDASVVGGTFAAMNLTKSLSGKRDEQELMHGLNDRLAGFIEKVHQLEYQNHLLEREIEDIRGKAKPASCFEEEYGPELRKLRQLVQDITHQKHQIEIEHRNLEEDLSNLRKQHEQEARSRSDVESNIVLFKKDVNDAYQAKLQLEKKAQTLVDEIHFLRRNHETEVSEMFDEIQNAQVTVKAHEFGHSGITAALRDIRAQLEGHAATDVRQVGETFRSQFARLTEAAETKRDALKATQQEIQEYRKRLQVKNIELDCAKGTREALEKQLHEVEDRHKEEVIHYQNAIKELENELINCKFDMSGYLREYQDLLNVKMALDVEILSYRKLLCGEEARLTTVSDTHISLPYIYHQSPIYTLPCLSRPGEPQRRVEPHYKFVEEIITETTREIEMSEFEETGSEETEAEKDECAKSDRGGSEEEKDNKDSREGEGEQMSDSQQNQVESVGNAVNKAADRDEGAPGEVDDGEREPETTEVVKKEESGKDTNTDSKVLLSEEENKQEQKVAGNTKEEKKAAVTEERVQKKLTSKPHDLTSAVSVGNEHEEISRNGKKASSKEGSVIQGKEPVHESLKTDELSSTGQAQKVQGLVSEMAEKPTGVIAETKSPLSVGEERAQTTKGEEKEHGLTEPKEKNKPKASKGEDKAITIQDDGHDSIISQYKKPSLTSDKKNLAEVKDQLPKSGDTTETTKTVLAKVKTMDNAETNHLSQGAPTNRQPHKPEVMEGSKKIVDSQDKPLKVESSK